MATGTHPQSATKAHGGTTVDLQEPPRVFTKLSTTHLVSLCLLPFIAITTVHMQLQYIVIVVMSIGFIAYLMTRPRPVYLVDYSCYRPPDNLKMNLNKFIERSKVYGGFNESSIEFQRMIIHRSGLGDETYLPAALHCNPPAPSMAAAKEEAELVMFGALQNLFDSTNVNIKDIGILVVNCSIFNPNPSLSSMIVNKFNLREDIKTFNLGGMGCSASLIAVDLAKDMLQVHRNTYAVVVSMENITQNWYVGNEKSMLISNCLFRMGCAAMLLSNKSTHKHHAKYKLLHVVRTHLGSNDTAFNCIYQNQDTTGKLGVTLSKDLIPTAGVALHKNITAFGLLMLPMRKKIMYYTTLILRKLKNSNMKPYLSDFMLAFDHICIHPGGRAVIDEIEKKLELSKVQVEPSRMTLYRFGNMSSCSIWYELAYMEAKGRIKKGNLVWQIAFGSGFKCNSVVWEAIRAVKPSPSNPWIDFIDKFPVEIKYVFNSE